MSKIASSGITIQILGAVFLLLALAQTVSGVAFPTGNSVPSASYTGLLNFLKADDFSAIDSTYWTAAPSGTTAFTAVTSNTPNYATALQLALSDTGAAATKYTYTGTSVTAPLGVRVVARASYSPTGAATVGVPAYFGWAEGGAAATAKAYFGTYATHTTAGATSGQTQYGYYDPSLAAGSQLVLSSAVATGGGMDTCIATATTGAIIIIDVKPSNISFGYQDTTNANPSTQGLYRAAATTTYSGGGNPITTITPATTGSLLIGGATTAAGGSGAATISANFWVDWIALYQYVAPTPASSPGASSSAHMSCSLISVILSTCSFLFYLKH